MYVFLKMWLTGSQLELLLSLWKKFWNIGCNPNGYFGTLKTPILTSQFWSSYANEVYVKTAVGKTSSGLQKTLPIFAKNQKQMFFAFKNQRLLWFHTSMHGIPCPFNYAAEGILWEKHTPKIILGMRDQSWGSLECCIPEENMTVIQFWLRQNKLQLTAMARSGLSNFMWKRGVMRASGNAADALGSKAWKIEVRPSSNQIPPEYLCMA